MANRANARYLPHVVIIGGGFGGLYTARALKRAPVRLTLIDRRNHHLFQPLLYEVATAALDASDIAYPIRVALRWQYNARVILATATAIDIQGKKVILNDGDIFYDYLAVSHVRPVAPYCRFQCLGLRPSPPPVSQKGYRGQRGHESTLHGEHRSQ